MISIVLEVSGFFEHGFTWNVQNATDDYTSGLAAGVRIDRRNHAAQFHSFHSISNPVSCRIAETVRRLHREYHFQNRNLATARLQAMTKAEPGWPLPKGSVSNYKWNQSLAGGVNSPERVSKIYFTSFKALRSKLGNCAQAFGREERSFGVS